MSFPIFGVKYYESNSMGALKSIVDPIIAPKLEYYITTDEIDKVETRILYKNGIEYKKWIFSKNHLGEIITEEYIIEGLMTSKKVYSHNKIIIEFIYKEGEVFLIEEYIYGETSGILLKKMYYSGQNELLYQDKYYYNRDSTIRKLVRTNAENVNTYGKFYYNLSNFIEREHSITPTTNTTTSYDLSGRLVSISYKYSDGSDYLENYFYEDLSRFYYKKEAVAKKDKVVLTSEVAYYDETGRITNQVIKDEYGFVISESSYLYYKDGSLLPLEHILNENDINYRFVYTYESDDSLIQKDTYVDEVISVKKYWINGTIKEEIFDEGNLVIVSYYDENEIKIKEEVIENGEVIFTRDF